MAKRRVLIIGANGVIGGAVRKALEDRYELSALGRTPTEGLPSVTGNIAELESIRPAFEGVDTVIHLASALPRKKATWDDYLSVNLAGTYNVFEAAADAGVARVIFASSGAVISGIEREAPYQALAGDPTEAEPNWPMVDHLAPIRPGNLYGATKAWGEALARLYADQRDMSILCLRIGHVTAEDRPTMPRSFPIWLSHRDCVQAVEKCIEAPMSLRFDVFFVSSQNRLGYRDLEHTRDVLGYEPQDRSEDYLS